jgi:hypothetical protein
MELKEVKQKMMAAMKAGKVVEKEALRTAIGDITTLAARENRDATAADVEAVVRKMVKSVKETLKLAPEDRKAELTEELAVLEALLPQTLSVEEIVKALAPVAEAVRAAKNDGQATGVAMKHLKVRAPRYREEMWRRPSGKCGGRELPSADRRSAQPRPRQHVVQFGISLIIVPRL